jgi:hypothetical protein
MMSMTALTPDSELRDPMRPESAASGSIAPATSLEVAEYIGDMAEQLAAMAQTARLPVAAHYLAIAAAETRRHMTRLQREIR